MDQCNDALLSGGLQLFGRQGPIGHFLFDSEPLAQRLPLSRESGDQLRLHGVAAVAAPPGPGLAHLFDHIDIVFSALYVPSRVLA